ncbi:N-acetylmannosamine-6-phosphate 2-epimerase [Jeotgalibaca ciconiae]|uniref:Putative N-acetylmannosamine-6-phosphate 2-epimerase n=1 Tax=Jeotgalibaca ciconiae TaxID=2496265 RepID=A0A3Q9BLQ1_9LACT|nr:N-acetylmannosamine-6-phosphate 2-epimerase [Jeotgalibaca ciconiae]AZP04851.1 N-acetylmannosamine-6-phosphate 2-epimerase [Jeotgalibaca ciconiae]
MEQFSLKSLKGKLIVSCQALEDEPLHSPHIMSKMALAAYQGGASGIRANGYEDIVAIKKEVPLPVIGILKKEYENYKVFITPTLSEVEKVVAAGADMIAVDATSRKRPDGLDLETFIKEIKLRYKDLPVMADISTIDEAEKAEKLGFDCISTTLVGYTEETEGQKLYSEDFILLKEILEKIKIPVIAEGNVITPEMAKRCLEVGAYAVVVGGAITRPQQITERFIELIKGS